MGRYTVWLLAAVGAVTGVLALVRGTPQAVSPTAPEARADPLDQALLTRARDLFRSEAQPVVKDIEERLRAVERLQEQIGQSVAVAEAIVEDARLAGGSGAGVGKEALGPLRSSLEEQRIRLAALVKAVDELTERVAALEARPPEIIREVAAGGGPVADTGPRVPTLPKDPEPDVEATQEEIARALNDLHQEDVSVVFRAIELVRKHKILAAVPRLLDILKAHKSAFARTAAAAALGEMESADSVPGLLDAMVDEEGQVGQQAFRSLRLITGFAEDMDPTARIRERRRMRGVVQQYWRVHEDEVRARLGQPKKDAE